jgi:predicted HicB family RNase H-like nuclease
LKKGFHYKSYQGVASYSDDDGEFHGKIEFIRDLVTYEGADVKSLRKAFTEAVDDYLAVCRQKKRAPELPFKGSFNVRTGSALHRKAALAARYKGSNLNSIVTEALDRYLARTEN